jgi:hypothetical protein
VIEVDLGREKVERVRCKAEWLEEGKVGWR